ncbi:recombinase family protein [Microbacterium sp. SORGH_AS_0888]|uniref:recombinase family protein n=1 Tax=Microbacterium sp. SORGH_AS_0888 TaxID=3041791 RepID=UPI00277E1DA9|nr:recombinase family protein [Microbacterium sp. SORGH_AS_0888]MDQ1130900.1 site-specific DNA recombinase [Microbacterium sp. SORGH_AS_0888]
MVYCRISDDREGDELGVQRQEEDCRALAAKMGLEVVGVKIDNDIGASTRTAKGKVRHAYADMIARARAGEFQHIIAYSNSRITRRVLELEDLIRLHEETEKVFGKGKGVIIQTVVSGNDDLSTADGRMVARIKASVDTAESERIAERIKRTNLQKAMEGRPGLQHRRHFGFEADARTHRPDEVALIREAVDDLLTGVSITKIRQRWQSQGVLTTDGKPDWGWTPVHRVLLGWKTAGVRSLNGKPLYDADGNIIMGDWEPIISLEDREAALAKLKQRTRRGVKEGRWLLSNLMFCGICEGKLYGQRDDRPTRSTYGCNSGKTNNHLSINALRVEQLVSREVFEYVFARTYRGYNAAPEPERVWPKEAELASIADRIDELMAAHASGQLPGEVVWPQVTKLNDQRAELRTERGLFHSEARAVPASRGEDSWLRTQALNNEGSSFEDRQAAIRAEVEAVWVQKASRGRYTGGRFEEEFRKRVSIVWRQPHPEVELLSDEEWKSIMVNAGDSPAAMKRLWELFTVPEEQEDSTP